MTKRILQFLILLALPIFALPVQAAPALGQPAPEFTLTDVTGKPVKLSDFRGRYVVLEWVNPDCPYVRRHYDSVNMPTLQKETGGKNVAWLSINSTRAGHSEFKTAAQMAAWTKDKGAAPSAVLLDSDSKVGKAYGATTTPHMYIIDPKGQLIYVGAIDDKRSASLAETKNAKNYVRAALGEAMAGKPVSTASTVSYGCTVKY
jgi:peroxiredoxin